jgi:cation diffusion facilitator family transporter
MLVSIIASILLSRHLLRVSRLTDSLALQANAKNIAADVYSSTAVLVGLMLVRFTGIGMIDSILAILVALFIFRVAYGVLKNSLGGLVDVKLPEVEEDIIRSAIREHFRDTEHYGNVVDFHNLRTRKAGSQRYIDLHLIMPRDTSLEEAHRMCDHLEEEIENRLGSTSVTIHVEPGDEDRA